MPQLFPSSPTSQEDAPQRCVCLGNLTIAGSAGIVENVSTDSPRPLGEWLRQRREELGISPDRLYAWRKPFGPADAGGRAAAGPKARGGDLQSQLDAERRENRHLREQRDILKKTLGILCEPSLNATNGSTR